MKKISFLLVAVMLASLSFMSCVRPYDKPEFVDIASNETAFIIPLTGKTSDQSALASEEYLRKNMVAAKRVQITHEWRQTGRLPNNGKWVPNMMVIKVNRSPVSVSWGAKSGATRVSAESIESIGFTVPIALTATIEEHNTPLFLSKYSADVSLQDVIINNVNPYVNAKTSEKFASKTLVECRIQKNAIVKEIYADVKDFFAGYGITITQFGSTDGLTYDSPQIQEAIDKQAILQAEGKALDEKELNAKKQRDIDLKNATNEASIAREKASAVSSLKALQEVENSKILAQAQADAIVISAKTGVTLPSVLPESMFYNLGLDKYVPSARK